MVAAAKSPIFVKEKKRKRLLLRDRVLWQRRKPIWDWNAESSGYLLSFDATSLFDEWLLI
jgi:hypothetical protein